MVLNLIRVYMVVDACTLAVLTAFHNTNWTYIDYIREKN